MKKVQGIRITLEAVRVNRGLTREEAASKLGIDTDILKELERHPDDVELRYYRAMAQVYRVPIHVFGGQNNRINI